MSCVLETLTDVELIQRKKYLLHQIDKIDKQLNIIKNESTDITILAKSIEPNQSTKIVKNIKIKINVKKSNLK